jgi:phosphate uptake regulator
LDQEKALRAKLHVEALKEFEQSLQDERSKHANTVEGHEIRLADLKKAHAQQCDELCREILKANVEADRLHRELKSKGVNIPRHTFFKNASATNNAPFSYLIATFITFFIAVSETL